VYRLVAYTPRDGRQKQLFFLMSGEGLNPKNLSFIQHLENLSLVFFLPCTSAIAIASGRQPALDVRIQRVTYPHPRRVTPGFRRRICCFWGEPRWGTSQHLMRRVSGSQGSARSRSGRARTVNAHGNLGLWRYSWPSQSHVRPPGTSPMEPYGLPYGTTRLGGACCRSALPRRKRALGVVSTTEGGG
jgi:hypothetical protein